MNEEEKQEKIEHAISEYKNKISEAMKEHESRIREILEGVRDDKKEDIRKSLGIK